jgi:exodeoxyribonuclease VII large subunit
MFEPPEEPVVAPPPSPAAAAAKARKEKAREWISVSELTDRMGRQLAAAFSAVCVMGEISKVTVAANGHTYFTIKDAGATLDAIVWASNRDALAVQPKLGLRVVATGGIRVFAPQGRYSLHVDTLEPVGAGDLQRAFEELKARLQLEGLFAESRKRPLPTFIRTLGIVTSPTGAVRHDIEQTLAKGGARLHVLLAGTRVQGEGASVEIAAAISLLAARPDVDLIVVARGGGSIEDLWPFNEEPVARAIAASRPPVISAVGHETDFTIGDFVADVRASTPSVAAGIIVDIQRRATERTASAVLDLARAIDANRERWWKRLDAVSTHRVLERERTKLERLRGRLAETFARVRVAFDRRHARRESALRDLATRCEAQAPTEIFGRARARVDRAMRAMEAAATLRQNRRRARFSGAVAKLDALSPLAVLSRGYALATTPAGRILFRANDVNAGDPVVIRLSRGRIRATVTDREEEA